MSWTLCHINKINVLLEYHTKSVFFWQLIHLSIRILNPNPMILFLLEMGVKWQWYSTNTLDGWKFIKIAIFRKKTWSCLEFSKFFKKGHCWQFQIFVSRSGPGPTLDQTQVQVQYWSGSRVWKKWLDWTWTRPWIV